MHVHTMHQAILSGESVAVPPSPSRSNDQVAYQRDKALDRSEGSITKDHHDRKYQEESERSVEKEHYENAFTCNQCTMKFSTLGLLRDHLVSIHRTDGFGSALMMCPLCGIPCASAAAYAEHYVLQHCENRRIAPLDAREYVDAKINGNYGDSKTSRSQKSVEQTLSEPADLTSKNSR